MGIDILLEIADNLTMKKLELTASILTLIAIWFLSEKLYTIGFGLSILCCLIWVYWCLIEKHFYLLTLEGIMCILYIKSLISVL